ncbi:MAG: DUF167 domain-containing protein [Gammaproteobacteria bacterium]|nr:DUF167 domain-containing protein [Gammaproteobacteria bacterium]
MILRGSAIRFEVHVQPRASRTELAGLHGGVLKVRVAAPPVEDAANRALAEFLAECLGVAKRSVRIVAGGTSRTKVIEVDGVTPEQVASLRERALR